jgi:hypothetical protein
MQPNEVGGAPVENPAISEEQFWHDEQRQLREAVYANPAIAAHTLYLLCEKVAALEDAVYGNGTNRQSS